MLPHFLPAMIVTMSIATLPSIAAAGLAVGGSAPFDPTKIRAVRSQEDVAAAANDSVTLFAWTDTRSGNADVYAARVRNDGTVLDPNGIMVAVTGMDESAPTVSWSGTEWLVAWERGGFSIHAARIAADGEVLDPAGIAIAEGAFSHFSPAAAGLGDGHLVVWVTNALVNRMFSALVGSDGSILANLSLATTTSSDQAPTIAVDGSTALVAFETNRNGNADVYGFRLERETSGPPALARVDAADFAISAGPQRETTPALAARAGGWLVAWVDSRNATSGNDIYAARVNASGTAQDATGIRVSDDAGNESDAAVHHNGNEWLVAWSQLDAGQFLRAVANNGNPANTRIDVSTASGTRGDAAFGGDADKPILAWSDPEIGTSAPTPPQDLLGRIVAQDLSLETPFVIATQTPNQTQPALSFGANRWFVAWVDDRYGPTEGRLRYAVTDSARLTPPDPASIAYVAARPGLDQQQPTACFDGTNFNLFWSEERGGNRQVFGARFTTGGAFIDSFAVTSGAWDHSEPTCTRQSGTVVLVAWTDARVPGDLDVWARQVVNGALFEDELAIADVVGVQEDRPQFSARVVDPGSRSSYLVYQRRTGPERGGISARFVYTSSFWSGGERFITGYDDTLRIFESPRVAWNGVNWLVTYQEVVQNDGAALYIPWANWIDVGYERVSPPSAMGPGSYVPANPVVGSTGHNFLLAWSDLAANQVDLNLRRANGQTGYLGDVIPYTDDAPVDVPGAALQGQGDRVGFAYLRQQSDAAWNGLRLFGAEARDTLVGGVVINEFMANPPQGTPEFLELFNVSGQSFNIEGWFIVVDGDSSEIRPCRSDAPGGGPSAGKGGDGNVIAGTLCGQLMNGAYRQDFDDFFGIEGSPSEGKLPNRGARLELYSPGGVKVDEVAYGFRGGAPVSPALFPPSTLMGADRTPLATEGADAAVFAPGDTVALSTARLPNGTDSDNDANDFNLTQTSTPDSANAGAAAALGSALFVSRVFWNPVSGPDAIELFNPSVNTFDFTNWYIGSNDGTQRIGVANNAWSVLQSLDKRVLRRGEPGAFTTDLDYLTVVYLLDPNFQRVEQIGWSRPDNQQPQMCLKREPDTGGFHNGFDWFTSGGEQNLFAGQLRYLNCEISAPDGTTPVDGGPVALSFRGAVPNPLPASGGALVFSVPGSTGGAPAHVRLRLIDVAGRARATLVDGPLGPGEHRVALAGAAAGIYYAELEVGGRRLSRPVVVVP